MNTIKASVAMKDELKKYQQNFFPSALTEADKRRIKGYSFEMGKDRIKLKHLLIN